MAFTGDATNTDPACKFSPHHVAFVAAAEQESAEATPPAFVYRRMGPAKKAVE
jgi:pyrroloquinoline quinone biosynthesis protein E